MLSVHRIVLPILFCISILTVSSCKTKKIVTGSSVQHIDSAALNSNEAAKMVEQARANNIKYDWLSARVKVEYSDNNLSQDFTAVIRMRRDSILWISLQGPFGIEGGRIMVTRDSIFVTNKLSGEYMRQPISYLSKIMPVQPDLPQLQDFMMGYFLLFAQAAPGYRGQEDSLQVVQAESAQFRYRSKLYPQNYTLAQSVLTDKMVSQEMSVTFGGYTAEQGKPFSTDRNIDIRQGVKTMQLHLVFNKVKINEPLSFPFDIDGGMRKVEQIRF